MKATINTLDNCPWCEKAKKLLKNFDISYSEVDGKSENWPTVPYIEIDGNPVGGFMELRRFCGSLPDD
jgi:glutaredoxin